MSSRETSSGPDGRVPPLRSVDVFLEAKLHWPRVREGWVDRHRLLDLFDQATRRPVTLVAAPAGYGKTTLASQWLASAQGSRAAAWVSLDAGDNDPNRLWTHVVTALERAGCTFASDVAAFMAGNSGDLMDGVLPRVVNAMAGADDVVLILDDFHYLQSAVGRDQVAFLIENLPEQGHLVILTRADPGLRLGRLRASGLLAEIRAEQLSFTADEAATLLGAERVQLSDQALGQLLGRTEGWPAGVYLAGLSLSGRPNADELVRGSSGNDRFVTSYFSEEVLSLNSERVRDFIINTSILDRFSASLCDAVAATTDAGEILDDLERKNLFLVRLDRDGRWFRFHHLFATVARSELEARHPDRVPQLHQRAAQWHEEHGHIEEAVSHLRAAGLRGEATRLIQANWLTFVDAGRAPTVSAWLQSLGRAAGPVDPLEEVTAAWMAGLFGDEAGLAQHVRSLAGHGDLGPLPDGSRSVESALALIRGMFGWGGPIDMRAGAERALELETDGLSPFHAMAHHALGHAAYVAGELNLATQMYGVAALSEAAPAMLRVQALSGQSLAEDELGRPERSRELAERAMETVETNQLLAVPQSSAAFTALGQSYATAGKLSDALSTLEQGLAMRRRYPTGTWGWIHHLMVMSRVAVQAGEFSMAQELLSDLTMRMSKWPDGMTAMWARQATIQSALGERIDAGAHEEQLTLRELDVLLLLQGSLSVREIGSALYLSSNTVKTHIQAVYRKLGAHSREEAVALARRDQLI